MKVLTELGQSEIDCVVIDLDGQKEKALNLALNKIQGDWDETKLAALMADLDASTFDVSVTGFDAEEVDALLNRFYAKEAVEDDFDVEKEKSEIEQHGATTQPSDIWQLSDHRLLCGDAACSEHFLRLMGKDRAQVAITSPPYGVGKSYEKAGIEPWLGTVKPAIGNLCRHADIVCWQIIDLYATGTQFIEPTGFYSVQMFADQGFRPIWIRIWKKQGMNFGIGPYHLTTNKPAQQYEYITAFAGQDETPEYNDQEYMWLSAFAGHSYRFVKRLTKEERKKWGYAGIWEMTTVDGKIPHPAMFPVELPWRCIKMHSDPEGIVLDPFCGAGTTLIAAEQTGRRCYGIERSPVYCDLTVKRWEAFTGETVVRLEARA